MRCHLNKQTYQWNKFGNGITYMSSITKSMNKKNCTWYFSPHKNLRSHPYCKSGHTWLLTWISQLFHRHSPGVEFARTIATLCDIFLTALAFVERGAFSLLTQRHGRFPFYHDHLRLSNHTMEILKQNHLQLTRYHQLQTITAFLGEYIPMHAWWSHSVIWK